MNTVRDSMVEAQAADVHPHPHLHPHHHADGHRPARRHPAGFGSLLMASAAVRVAGAMVLIAMLWLAVAWALSGSP